MMQQRAPLAGLVVAVGRALETSHIYLTAIWNINSMVHFINTNNNFMYTLTEIMHLTYFSQKVTLIENFNN